MYLHLARYYDDFFDFSGSWGLAARNRILRSILPDVSSACDLACGTGTTAIEMARRGIEVYAVDLSATMCRMAQSKARREKASVTVVQGDMRSFRLPTKVDLVTCEFDALNHVPSKSDLPKVARAVSRALNPGGYFYFDVNTLASFQNMWPLTWWVEKPGLALVTHGGYDAATGKAHATAEIFIRGRRDQWKRVTEYVEEVCWSADEIYEALEAAGFDSIQVRDAKEFFRKDPMIRPGYRTYYLARKRHQL